MSVSRLDANDDWTFGAGRDNYARNSDEVAQNVITRLRFLLNDWFLAVSEGIDWYGILSQRGNEAVIRREITRSVINTEGVRTLDTLELTVNTDNRTARAVVNYTDVFDNTGTLLETLGV